MDEDDASSNPERLRCRQKDEEEDRGHTGDPIHTRKGLIRAIDDKLKEYGRHPFKSQLVSIPSSPFCHGHFLPRFLVPSF